jgi:hypothetical protein
MVIRLTVMIARISVAMILLLISVLCTLFEGALLVAWKLVVRPLFMWVSGIWTFLIDFAFGRPASQ